MRRDRHRPSLFRQRESARWRLFSHWIVSWVPGRKPLLLWDGLVGFCGFAGMGASLVPPALRFFEKTLGLRPVVATPLALLLSLFFGAVLSMTLLLVLFSRGNRGFWLGTVAGQTWKSQLDSLSAEFARAREACALRRTVFFAKWTSRLAHPFMRLLTRRRSSLSGAIHSREPSRKAPLCESAPSAPPSRGRSRRL